MVVPYESFLIHCSLTKPIFFLYILYVLRLSLLSDFCPVLSEAEKSQYVHILRTELQFHLIYKLCPNWGSSVFVQNACYVDAIVIHCVVYFCRCFNKVNLFKISVCLLLITSVKKKSKVSSIEIYFIISLTQIMFNI